MIPDTPHAADSISVMIDLASATDTMYFTFLTVSANGVWILSVDHIPPVSLSQINNLHSRGLSSLSSRGNSNSCYRAQC